MFIHMLFTEPYLFYNELSLIPAWKIIVCSVKYGIKSFLHSQASTSTSLKVGNGEVISRALSNGCTYLSMM